MTGVTLVESFDIDDPLLEPDPARLVQDAYVSLEGHFSIIGVEHIVGAFYLQDELETTAPFVLLMRQLRLMAESRFDAKLFVPDKKLYVAGTTDQSIARPFVAPTTIERSWPHSYQFARYETGGIISLAEANQTQIESGKLGKTGTALGIVSELTRKSVEVD